MNFLEYALGTHPLFVNSPTILASLSQPGSSQQRLKTTLFRDPARTDVNIIVEASPNLVEPWTLLATSTAGAPFYGPGMILGDSSSPGVKRIEIRDVVKVGAAPARFIRVRVEP